MCKTSANEQCEKLVKTSVKMCVRLCETVCKTSVNEQCEKLVKTSVTMCVRLCETVCKTSVKICETVQCVRLV